MSNGTFLKLLSNRLFVISLLMGLILLISGFVYFFIVKGEKTPPAEEIPMVKDGELPLSEAQTATPSPEQSPSESEADQPSPTPSPMLASGEIKALSSKEAVDPWLSIDGRSLRYLSKNEGAVYQFATSPKEEEVFTSFTPNLAKIIWSPNGFHFINIFKQDGGKFTKYSYNSNTKENTLLNENMKFITWSPDGERIAYHFLNPETEEGFINVADPDGKNWETLTPVLATDLELNWPQKNKLSFYNLFPSSLVESDLNILNPEAKNPIQKILSKKYGLKIIWSPSGSKLLFSASNEKETNPKLYILNEALEEKNLDVEGLADKCVWSKSEKHIYCALPQNLDQNPKLPQDWYAGKFLSQDQLFKIDIETKEETPITQKAEFDFSNLILTPDESHLYFINKESGFLYGAGL